MGKRGPQKKDTLAVVEPLTKKRPAAPSNMTARARYRWKMIVDGYVVDHFQAGDLPLLRAYCEAHDRALRAEEALIRDGDYIKNSFGLKAHPACAVKIAAESLMSTLATKLRICANSRITPAKAGSSKVEPASPGRKMFGG